MAGPAAGWVVRGLGRLCTRCGYSVGSTRMGHRIRGVVTSGFSHCSGIRICGRYFDRVSLASLGMASARSGVNGVVRHIGRFRARFPRVPGITTIYVCPTLIPMAGTALRTRNIGVTTMSTYFPSSRAFVRTGMTRITLATVTNTGRVSIMRSINGFFDKLRARIVSRLRRLGSTYRKTRLGIVLRANRLRGTIRIGRTSLVTVTTNTSFVGASANGASGSTARRTMCMVYATVGRCCRGANVGVNVGPSNNVTAAGRTIRCCAVIHAMLNRR